MKCNSLFIVILLLCYSSVVLSQSSDITINLSDSESQEPLIGATIQIDELEIGTVTDLDGVGSFVKVKYGTYRFEFSYVGYEEIDTTLIIDEPYSVFDFSLNVEGEELEGVTIATTRSTRTIKKIPTRLEFIGGEELEEKAIMNGFLF